MGLFIRRRIKGHMKKLKEYILSTIGVAIVAFGLEYFFFPLDIAAGGVSGLALAINQLIDFICSCIFLNWWIFWSKKYICYDNDVSNNVGF